MSHFLGFLRRTRPDPEPLVLDEEEKKELARFDAKIIVIRAEKIEFLKKLARKKGLSAGNLKALKSKCGAL